MKPHQQTEKICLTCKHNEPFLNKKCVGCANYMNANSNSKSELKWESVIGEVKQKLGE